MPAGYTHMTLSRMASDKLSGSNLKTKMLLKRQLGPYIAGSVGPDIPYMAPFDDHNLFDDLNHVADEIHVHHTMEIPYAGIREAKAKFKAGNIEEAEALYAFFLGYLSHVVLDGFTHPFIRDRVGDYGPKTKVAHRDLEMQLDVLVLDYYLGLEANEVSPQKDLTLLHDSRYEMKIFDAYSRFLMRFHKKDVGGTKLKSLADGMIAALNIAEGNPSWYSVPLGGKGLVYLDLQEAKKNEKWIRTLKEAIDRKEKGIFYNSLGLKDIDIFDDVFPRYLKFFPKVIAGSYQFVFEDGDVLEELVPAINLDTGRPLHSTSLTDKPALWELA